MSQERLIKSTATTSDAQGKATFTLGPAEQGYVWQGTVQVPNSPAGALFIATILNTNWGQWAGPTNFGEIQLYGGETLQVSATGLTPSTNYVLTIFGVWMEEEEAKPIPPAAPLSTVSVETATKLIDAVTFAGSSSRFFTVPSLTRRVTLAGKFTGFGVLAPTLLVQGVQSGIVYFSRNYAVGRSQFLEFIAIEPTIDQQYEVAIGGTIAQSCTLSVVASFSNPMIFGDDDKPIPITGSSVPGFPPINVSGSPVGPFKSFVQVVTGAGVAINVIAAPGAGLSIYLQKLQLLENAAAAVVAVQFTVAGTVLEELIMANAAGTPSQRSDFPGGFELPANTPLLATVTGGLCRFGATYTVGPSL